MIRLRSDCLEFELSNGEKIPCSAHMVTVELLGSAIDTANRHLVENAAAAVLHYFQNELHKTSVTLGEFTDALESALRAVGLEVTCENQPRVPLPESAASHTTHSDLRLIATESGKAFELGFFHNLRKELRERLRQSPGMLRFHGLRSCVKQITGARRWGPRCQQMNDHIVDYLRGCLAREGAERPCDLVVM